VRNFDSMRLYAPARDALRAAKHTPPTLRVGNSQR
jgi:hypothetical protein